MADQRMGILISGAEEKDYVDYEGGFVHPGGNSNNPVPIPDHPDPVRYLFDAEISLLLSGVHVIDKGAGALGPLLISS